MHLIIQVIVNIILNFVCTVKTMFALNIAMIRGRLPNYLILLPLNVIFK